MIPANRATVAAPTLGSRSRSKVNFTSLEVSSWPLWNFTPLRRLKVQERPSALTDHFSARLRFASGRRFSSTYTRKSPQNRPISSSVMELRKAGSRLVGAKKAFRSTPPCSPPPAGRRLGLLAAAGPEQTHGKQQNHG